jgi:SAM-dependent methyltransferase
MPKLNEIHQLRNYFTEVDPEVGAKFVLDKPFSHEECPRYLIDLGRVMCLLPAAPARILDLGVGMGWTSVFLAKRGYEVVGQDICGDLIAMAEQLKDRYGVASASFVVQDYEAMAYRKEFDGALFYDALHHAEDERAALAKVYEALKPGGVCLTVEPGEGHADSEPTLKYVEAYGVTEKDMPPRHIIALAKDVGFRSFRVYHRDLDTNPRLIADLNSRPAAPMNGPRPGRARVALRFAKKAARAMLKGTCDEDHSFLFGWRRPALEPELRESSIVWMQK